jgi:hypothetical protein
LLNKQLIIREILGDKKKQSQTYEQEHSVLLLECDEEERNSKEDFDE